MTSALLAEVRQAALFSAFLARRDHAPLSSSLPAAALSAVVESGMAAFALHVEARLASARGQGFYTITPCGEELTGFFGLHVGPHDTAAWHYRHLSAQIALHRQSQSLQDIILNRARGYVCSALDPVTGGRHCSLGGSSREHYVTSTLASQAPPAVGRALADPLMRALRVGAPRSNSVHFVSVGDGSIHSAHFLSAVNLARHAAFRGIKCPVLFCVTDNGLSISYKTADWALKGFAPSLGLPTFACDGRDADAVHAQTGAAFARCRADQAPALLLLHSVPRRFGHAASDRQASYLSLEEIAAAENANPLLDLCRKAASHPGLQLGFDRLERQWADIQDMCRSAFATASKEPRLSSVSDIASKNQAPLPPPPTPAHDVVFPFHSGASAAVRWPMRRFVTASLEREMDDDARVVLVGEDIRHGGYYLCTDGLAAKFPSRVLDFPPDETTLMGVGMGFAQRGLVPVVEIPYLKYLDCAHDLFQEASMLHWLTNGRERCGMVVRLQGFDRGVFGGNFHTHNVLGFLNPGLDVVCFSNGPDYARGMRQAVRAARAGRVVALLEPTELLNRRHVVDGDDKMLFDPALDDAERDFDAVAMHGRVEPGVTEAVVVCYGNGVVSALQARAAAGKSASQVVVADCALLSRCPAGLLQVVQQATAAGAAVLFADSCKAGSPNPLSLIAQSLKMRRALQGASWNFVAAADTWNPLGGQLTFLDAHAIRSALDEICK